MRKILIGVAVLALVLWLVAYLILRSPTLPLRAVAWGIDNFTSLNIEVVDPHIDLLAGDISASQIHLYQDTAKTAPLVSILDFSVRTTLRDLLYNNPSSTSLRASSLSIYVVANDSTEDPSPANWMRHLKWLPNTLDIDKVHLITAAETTWIFPLKDLKGRRSGLKYHVTAGADYEGEPLEVTLDLGAMRDEGEIRGMELSAQFLVPADQSLASLQGELRGGKERFSFDFELDANFSSLDAVLVFIKQAPDLEGSLMVRGRLQGDTDSYTISDAEFELNNMPDYGFQAAGSFQYRAGGINDIKLVAAGEMDSLSYLVDWFGLDLAGLGRARANMRLSGAMEALAVDQFILQTRSDTGLWINVSGKLEPGALGSGTFSPQNSIAVDVYGPSMQALKPWLGEPPVDLGQFVASARLAGNTHFITVRDIVAVTGSPDQTLLRLGGHVGGVRLEENFSAASISGVSLSLSTQADDPGKIAQWLGIPLPPDHRISGVINIGGSGDHLLASQGKLRLYASDLETTLEDISADIQPARKPVVSDVKGQLQLTLSDTSALSQYAQRSVPVLGPLRATAQVRQQADKYALNNIKASVAGGDMSISITGNVADVSKLDGSNFKGKFSGISIRDTLATLIDDFQYTSQLGTLVGSFDLRHRRDEWGIHELSVTAMGNDDLRFAVSGTISDLTGAPLPDLVADVNIRNQGLLKALSGLALQPVAGHLRLTSSGNKFGLKASTDIGSTAMETQAEVVYSNDEVASFILSLTTPHLYLRDLGLQAEETSNPQQNQKSPDQPDAFTTMVDKLPRFPMDIQARVGGLSGHNTNIKSLDLHITGEDHRYTLRRFNVYYSRALAEIQGMIDLNPTPHAITLAGQALAIPLNDLTRDLGIKSDIEGILNLRGGISARGDNAESWLGSLDGNVAVSLEDAIIEGAAYDVLATDLLAWLYSGAALEKSTHVDCTMAQFSLRQGVANSDSIFVESPRMIATGKGEFDLVRKRLDLTLTPRSKSRRVQIPSSITVKGDMAKPKTSISALATTVDASAEALMLIPSLAMKIFGLDKKSDGPSRPCEAVARN